MKQIVNKKYFFGLFLLSVFLMVGIVSVTNGQTVIDMTKGNINEHIVRLHSLFLWNGNVNDTVSMKINTGENFLSISGGLAVGSNHSVGPDAVYSAIGGGSGNSLYGEGNGIVGGVGNSVDGKYSLIGGGEGNSINAENSVIGGGSGNSVVADNSVVAGGEGNSINVENSVILGGQGNTTNGRNSLVLGQNAEGNTGSFAWSAKVSNPNSARIDTKSGVLIGTYTPIDGVKLVISGAVSLTDAYSTGLGIGGEIKVVNGCIYAYDGNGWQVMGKSSRQSEYCGGEIQACQFGETLLYPGDTVDAYINFWGLNSCQSIKVMCSGGNLVKKDTNQTGTYYPYCYVIGGSNGGSNGGGNGGSNCDISGNGEVNQDDMVLLSNLIVNGSYDVKYDVNEDGKVDYYDIDYCRTIILGN